MFQDSIKTIKVGGRDTQLKIRDESAQRSGKRSAPIRVDLDEILLKFTGETGPFWKISARLFIRDLDRTYVGLPT